MSASEQLKLIGQLVGVTLDVHDLGLSKKFWQAILGAPIKSESDRLVIFEPQAGSTGLTLQKVREEKVSKNRMHPDVRLADLDDGVRKLKALGARVLQELTWGDHRWVIMADPDGNEFCALQ